MTLYTNEVEYTRGLERQVAELRRLVCVLLDNDPDAPIADNGMTALDGWRVEARAALGIPVPEIDDFEAAALVDAFGSAVHGKP